MKGQRKNIITALFLLSVFSLTNIAGFACSIGIDMGYNTTHHQVVSPNHEKTTSYQHVQKPVSDHCASKEKDEHNDCCSDQVTKFIQLDKSLSFAPDLQVPVFILSNTYYNLPGIFTLFIAVDSKLHFVRRSCFLNDIDIQTAIRRFQI